VEDKILNPEEEWALWREWLGAQPTGKTIKAQIIELLAFRQIWDGFAYVYDNAPAAAHEEGTFLWWVRFGYARSQALGVRRMADMSRDVLSLAKLIDRVWRFPTVLTRERFLAMQGASVGNLGLLAQRWFDDLAGAGDYIDPRIPAQDFEALQTKTAIVRKWVNTSVAHLNPKGRPLGTFRLQAIHEAVDVVADLFTKYNALIGGETLASGVIMPYWPTVFRVPWIQDDNHYRRVLTKLNEAEARREGRPSA
jgi:hypothetical protein